MAEREWLRQMVELMLGKLKGGARVDRREFYRMCVVLSKAMDCAVAANQSPHCVHDVIQLLKQVCTQKDDADVRPAIVLVMLSFKGAVQKGWFNNVEYGDLLCVVNELLDLYDRLGSACVKTPTDFSSIEKFTGDVLMRLYPWLKLGNILLYIEAEAGYRTVVSEFYIHTLAPVKLFTIRRDAVEQPSCLTPPALVSFILNGYPVDRRTPLQMDSGPQPPAECARYCRLGNNVLQVVGEFAASYVILVAHTKNAILVPTLLDLPETWLFGSQADDDLMEGASKVSLCCPISRQRIATPVKGLACKHLQCFDFKNYTEMNTKRPSWRCPYCNVVVTLQDLRIDMKMAKILREVDGNIKDVMLTNNGSWQMLESHPISSRTKKTVPVIVDLSEIDNEDAPSLSPSRPPESTTTPVLRSSSIFSSSPALTEDRKPDIASLSRTWSANNVSSIGLAPSRSLPANLLPSTPNGSELRQHQRNTPTTRLRLHRSDTERLMQQLAAVQAQHALQAQAAQQSPQAQVQMQQQIQQHAQLRQAHPVQVQSLLQQTQESQAIRAQAQAQQQQQQQAQLWQTHPQHHQGSFSRRQAQAQQQQAQILYAQHTLHSQRAPAQQSQQAAPQQAAQQQSPQFQLQPRQIHPWLMIPGSSNDPPQ
ncbi:E4 SUMO-protein ligase PIAL2 isoform X1 [Selaginella moellendorffii]|uniref:E4 SUMO-protein ligase PIAL2 isoform X1 n=1 Tax=Selaginella moellendorffii TaxID=88036 RepID=UPI000D1C5E40|nr:E4 SUMO-protein ligase PIAL2 isoform X1 [Selaginella moellendorffii]|eukprot:XP_024530538.1 E4 SUMO-protein ligase PIAL2 isoform X1 [Selaginella moellendorffii]